MIDHYNFEKNRISFPAKIRASGYELDKQKLSRDGSARKVIRLSTSDSVGSLDPDIRQTRYSNDKTVGYMTSSVNVTVTPVVGKKSKIFEQPEWGKSTLNKTASMYGSWIKMENSEVTSRISKVDLTKRSDFGDFNELDRNITFSNLRNYDNNFEEPTKNLSASNFLLSTRNTNDLTRENTLLERTIQEKNREISNLMININEERKILETKIMKLEFQIVNQKLTSERTIDSITFSLKNIESICRNQQNEIERLKEDLCRAREEKRIAQDQHKARTREIIFMKQELEGTNQELVNEVANMREQMENNIRENEFLKQVLSRIEEDKLLIQQQLEDCKEKLDEMHTKMLSIESTSMQETIVSITEDRQIQVNEFSIDPIEGVKVEQIIHLQFSEYNPEKELVKDKGQFQQQNQQRPQQQILTVLQIESKQDDLMRIICQHKQEIYDVKKKLIQSEKYIESLEHKIRALQIDIGILSLSAPLLLETNEEIMILRLKNFNDKFQYIEDHAQINDNIIEMECD